MFNLLVFCPQIWRVFLDSELTKRLVDMHHKTLEGNLYGDDEKTDFFVFH